MLAVMLADALEVMTLTATERELNSYFFGLIFNANRK